MSKLTRRQLLVFFGASAGTAVLAPVLGERLLGNGFTHAQTTVPLSFTPVRLPHPLPIYQNQVSYLPIGIGKGNLLQPASDVRLTTYTVLDDVIVPPEYERYVIVRWGDRVFPNKNDYFGFNCDYTSFVPIQGNLNDGYLWVNHEYVSYPISTFAPGTPEDVTDTSQFPEAFPTVIGFKASEKNRALLGEFLYNVGGSIVRIAKDNNGRYQVVSDPNNRRIHGLSGLAINSQRSDQYKNVTSWGNSSHQKGDNNYLIGTGPAAKEVFNLSVDGLGNKIIGTAYNCSGGTTPWNTILSAEENFQGSSTFFVGVTEAVNSDGTQVGYIEETTGAEFGLVGEKYGWMVEIDPYNPNFRPRKHTALGRFRHENIAFRAEIGKKLIGYMGDDRRGGHTWKFVSKGTVVQPVDGNNRKDNSVLFEEGTLYVAKYNPPSDPNQAEGTGEWIPLVLSTATNPISPSVLASVELAALGTASRDGLIKLPSRMSTGQEVDGGSVDVTIANEDTVLPLYKGKKLSDFYTSQGAVLVDAFPAANVVGGTPTARPEDIEVNPRNPREIFIAYTDGAAGSDGYPDSRIFIVSKYSEAITAAQPSGALFKIIEDSEDSTGTTFRWERFVKGGEAASEPGDGFANVDNLAFDPQGNIWGVTDMSTSAHNGFNVGAAAEPLYIEHTVVGSESPSVIDSNQNVETSNLIGVFGNNWLFFIPTSGSDAGEIVPFAYGPPRCEMTGPTFVGNDTLIIAVQHPSEDCPYTPQATLSRDIEMLNLDGTLFKQKRTVPRGSNWPSNIEGKRQGPPRPSVIGIRRKDGKSTFI
ncbi:PhoX family phosphatase [Gloeocapsopsis crepidinum LEGE 06123]|uniref:PhoX family phosphatase n=1 Tax=Gloeocapsopsis crepidinum LEGE 06123 TaxID=588587 RepID=A0ABR9UYT4_9CHRO|nr:PhoX family phosphatase [Gloeocapsopsis crepidinum]MBE9193462.1 PhoX family phosphatase [Gloeocapsopsis crepidinum LEGE 06123]